MTNYETGPEAQNEVYLASRALGTTVQIWRHGKAPGDHDVFDIAGNNGIGVQYERRHLAAIGMAKIENPRDPVGGALTLIQIALTCDGGALGPRPYDEYKLPQD